MRLESEMEAWACSAQSAVHSPQSRPLSVVPIRIRVGSLTHSAEGRARALSFHLPAPKSCCAFYFWGSFSTAMAMATANAFFARTLTNGHYPTHTHPHTHSEKEYKLAGILNFKFSSNFTHTHTWSSNVHVGCLCLVRRIRWQTAQTTHPPTRIVLVIVVVVGRAFLCENVQLFRNSKDFWLADAANLQRAGVMLCVCVCGWLLHTHNYTHIYI